MITNRDIAKLYICRRCLNKYSLIKFKNYELRYKYYYYHSKCTECGEMHHIVKSSKIPYAWKLFFVKKPSKLIDGEDVQYKRFYRRRSIKRKIKNWLNL